MAIPLTGGGKGTPGAGGGEPGETFFLLLESGDRALLEIGDKAIQEDAA